MRKRVSSTYKLKLYAVSKSLCSICKKVKDLNDFHTDNSSKNGKKYCCKKCNNKYQRDRKKRLKEGTK